MNAAFALYLARRLLIAALLLLIISFAVFSLLFIAPGDPIQALIGVGAAPSPETVQHLRQEYHLDEPFLAQYWFWLQGALQLDFGESITTHLSVTETIKQRLPVTLFLGTYAFTLTMVFGIGLGVLAALRKRSVLDRGIVAGVLLGISTPAFVTGLLLLYVFSISLPWFPSFGAGSGFVDRLWHLTLPAVAMAVGDTALIVRHTRASMINVLDQDYLTFARARGLSRWRCLYAYALRNALIPVVTVGGFLLSFLLTSAVLVEITFSLPGIGNTLVNAATSKDIPLLQGVALLVAAMIILGNLIADIAYMVVDPRIRIGGRAR